MTQPRHRTTRERRHARTRQEIIDASMQLVGQEGAANLSLREIAAEIDYSPAGLYEYFDSKDALIDAVCREFNQRLLMMLKAVPTDISITDYLIELGLAYIKFARDKPELFILFFTHFPSSTQVVPKQGDLQADDSFAILFNTVQRGIDEGVFPPHNRAFDLAYMIWAQVHGMAMMKSGYLSSLDFDFPSADRRAIRALIQGLSVEGA